MESYLCLWWTSAAGWRVKGKEEEETEEKKENRKIKRIGTRVGKEGNKNEENGGNKGRKWAESWWEGRFKLDNIKQSELEGIIVGSKFSNKNHTSPTK